MSTRLPRLVRTPSLRISRASTVAEPICTNRSKIDQATLGQNVALVLDFTAASIVRGDALRRLFEGLR